MCAMEQSDIIVRKSYAKLGWAAAAMPESASSETEATATGSYACSDVVPGSASLLCTSADARHTS